MGKLHVFEETGEVRVPSRDEFWLQRDGSAIRATYDYEMKLPILRRLTDEEVAKLVALQPADDERGRFVRETAAMVMAHQFAMWTVAEIEDGDHSVSYSEGAIDQIVKAAESLAARLWEKRA